MQSRDSYLTVNVSTTQETTWSEKENKSIWLNESDKEILGQNFSFALTSFNYKGSLEPLIQLIVDWIKPKMLEGIDQSIKKK